MSKHKKPIPSNPDVDSDLEPTPVPAADHGAEVPELHHHLEDDWEQTESVPAQAAASAVAEAEERFLRLAAEYDNYRKRTTREKGEAFDRGAAAVIARLMEVFDDIDRLAASDAATTDYTAFRSAFDLISRKMAKELEASGLERIDPTGARFDPVDQDAVASATPDAPALDDMVKATFQVGYRFRGTAIRPAKVQVWSVDGSL
jgi:molecular chaperone GrpE